MIDDYITALNNEGVTVYLMPEKIASFEVKFNPLETGKYKGQVQLLVADNPYENLIIDLSGEACTELIVLKGLELANVKSNTIIERRESNSKLRKSSSRSNTTIAGKINIISFYMKFYFIYQDSFLKYLFLFII